MSKKKIREESSDNADHRPENAEESEILPLLVDGSEKASILNGEATENDGDAKPVSKIPENKSVAKPDKKVVLYQDDALVDRVGHNKTNEVGKSFRSKELSEEDLVEPEVMPTIEEQWVLDEIDSSKISWVKRFIVAGILLAASAGIWAFFNLNKEEVAIEERALEIKELAQKSAQSDAEYNRDQEMLLECVKSYVEAPSIEERAKICRNPKETLRRMTDYYNSELTFDTYQFESILTSSEVTVQGNLVTVVAVNVTTQNGEAVNEPISLLLEKQEDGSYRADWETAVVYQPNDWSTFISTKSDKPSIFRVEAKERINYGPYLFHFSDDEEYQAYRINIRGNAEKYLLGYAKKDSAADKKMKELVLSEEDTNKNSKITAPMILKLAFPKDAQSEQCVEIIEVVSESWFLP